MFSRAEAWGMMSGPNLSADKLYEDTNSLTTCQVIDGRRVSESRARRDKKQRSPGVIEIMTPGGL